MKLIQVAAVAASAIAATINFPRTRKKMARNSLSNGTTMCFAITTHLQGKYN